MFKFSINDFFFFVSRASENNFATVNNSLSAVTKTVAELKNTLQPESKVAINWFKNNEMIANPEKFEAIIIVKQKHDYSNETTKFHNKTIETVC